MHRNLIINSIVLVISLLVLFGCSLQKNSVKNNSSFCFFVLGDWGIKGEKQQMAVARAMKAEYAIYNPGMIITVGDNFYEAGVANLQDEHWLLSYENVYGEMTRKCPWYVSLGNHDYRGNVQAEIDYNRINPDWNMPSRYYTFVKTTSDNQKVRFIVIDTNPFITSYYTDPYYKSVVSSQDTARQVRWVDSVLAQAKEPWKIVYGHHPLFSAKGDINEIGVLRKTFQPVFDKYHIQAYICGHDHLLQYNRLSGSKVAYIISGGGAKLSESTAKQNFTKYNGSIPGFTVCTIKGKKLTINFIDTSGRNVYHCIIRK